MDIHDQPNLHLVEYHQMKQPLEHRIQAECKLSARLFIRLGGRKVDVIIKDPTMPLQLIHEQAITHGIIL